MIGAGAVGTAVILAAGLGSRLGARGRQEPKGFLKLGVAPIVEESLARLQAAGVVRVVVVIGHLGERYRKWAGRFPGRVETVENPEYAASGSLASLVTALGVVDEDFLLLESDLIYEPRALAACLAAPGDRLLVSGPTGSRDEVWVEAEAGRLVGMSKDRSRLGRDPVGELVGITRISVGLGRTLVRVAGELAQEDGHRRHHYETDGLVRATRDHRIEVVLVPDLVWAEIDDEAHLKRAQEAVYPRIPGCGGPT